MQHVVERQDSGSKQLLVVIEQLLGELRPQQASLRDVTLDSALDADLGLDSLGRVELLARLEREFQVALPQSVFTDAETPRDLLRAISSARGRSAGPETAPIPRAETRAQLSELPVQANNLLEVLDWHRQHAPQRVHIRVLDEEHEVATITYAQLWHGAQEVAIGLQQLGVLPGETVSLMLPTGREYFFSFMAILMAGAIPVPIYPPVRMSQLEEHLRRHSGILQNCRASYLITVPQAKLVAGLLKSQVASLRNVVTVAELPGQGGTYLQPVIGGQDIAFLQYTSGSTGNPKGVVLTHANLLANIRVMGEVVKASSRDVFVSWLPLYHDMGLIGAWFGSLYYAMELVVMSPIAFITQPQRWLWAMHNYRGTLSAAPNFGYELCLKRIVDSDLQGLDLQHWRLAFNGAEQVSPATIARFTQRFKPYGFREQTMTPVYGLAESSVGLAFSDIGKPPAVDCVKREQFSKTGRAEVAVKDDETALCFVSSGQPLPGHQIRIVDDDDREVPDRQEGHLQFKGPSTTSGYYHNPAATRALFKDEWLESGDMAYAAAGDIFVTGRSKDIIIRAGRNIYPHELEEAVGNIPGIRKGCVVAFGSMDVRNSTEQLVIVAETNETEPAARRTLQAKVVATTRDLLGIPPEEVKLVAPHTVLKTSSGKVRRSACRELYEQGRLSHVQKGRWAQVSHLLLTSILPSWIRLRRRLVAQLFAAYAWSLFGMLATLAFVAVLLLPFITWRWHVVRALLRLLAVATATRLSVTGRDNLPPLAQPCVYVANHASYIDALVLIAALPRNLSFVAKIELTRKPLLRMFLKRLQVEFVERFDRHQVLLDAERLMEKARQAQSLLFFAEGTFTRIPGLREFYMGAFLTAAQAGICVVPIAIRGTRSILRAESWFPRHGQVAVTIGEAVCSEELRQASSNNIWQVALALRDRVREHIAQYCGEPDLLPQKREK